MRMGRQRSAAESWRRSLRAAALVVALVSLLPLARGLYLPAKAATAQLLLEATWRLGQVGGGAPLRPWPWADTHAVARLTAPSRGVSVIVLAGASGRTLAFGPGHVAGTAAPGSGGHVAIAGHRDTHFAFLADLEVGDEMILRAVDMPERRYRVVETAVVDESRTDLLAPSASATPTLTLVTCYPFGALTAGGPLRYLVRAKAHPLQPFDRDRAAAPTDQRRAPAGVEADRRAHREQGDGAGRL